MRIRPQDVSIVFQGAIGRKDGAERVGVRRALGSALHFYPGAEVILATWKGTVDEEFPGVQVVECEDPGSIPCAGAEILNLNRQLVSSREGLARATRPWAVKIRTDMFFRDGGLFRWFERIQGPSSPVSDARILVLNLTSRNPRGPHPYPFMVCDWLYAGLRTDLVALFEVPLYPLEFATWFTPETVPTNDPFRRFGGLCRYYAEAYLWFSFVRRRMDVPMEHSSDDRPEVVAASEEIAARNLIMLPARMAGVGSCKHRIPTDYHFVNYSYVEWLRLLDRHGQSHTLPRPRLDLEKAQAACEFLLLPRLRRLQGILRRLWRGLARRLPGR